MSDAGAAPLAVLGWQGMQDPSTKHTTINAATFTCEGFPRPLTQADIDALYKRALDAEDHLRREVASNQALNAVATAVNDGMKIVIEDRNATIANLRAMIGGLQDIINIRNESIDALHKQMHDVVKARDQAIADLRERFIGGGIVSFATRYLKPRQTEEASRLRSSIVAFVRKIAAEKSEAFKTATGRELPRMLAYTEIANSIATQIERGDDLGD